MKRYLGLLLLISLAGCGSTTSDLPLLQSHAVTWGDIQISPEQSPAEWDWSGVDEALADQPDSLIVPIFPYALWDQAQCHAEWPSMLTVFGPSFQAPYPPCDQAAYTRWLTALAERYADQVAAWQILAVPTDQVPPTAQFVGSAQAYAELVEISAEAIYAADSEAIIYVGNLSDLSPETITFYTEVLAQSNVQSAVQAFTVNTDVTEDGSVIASLVERVGWDLPTQKVYTVQ